MKKYAITLLISILANCLMGQNNEDKGKTETVKWMSVSEAFERNKTSYPKKKIFIDFYTDWCGWCKRMDQTTFGHPEIAKFMNEHFWNVKFDAEMADTVKIDNSIFINPRPGVKRSTHQFASNMLNNRMSYPSYAFLNESNNMITTVPGYYKPQDFETILKYIGLNEYLKMPFDQFKSEFKNTIIE
jgi:thioredoxin-related protein